MTVLSLLRRRAAAAWEEALSQLAPMRNRVGRAARRKLKELQHLRAKRANEARIRDEEALQRNKEQALAEFAARLARIGPGDVCLDLGANVGEVTVQLAATGALVHAFEPDPLAWGVLVQNLGHLPNVRLHNAAVAADPGTYRLQRPARFAEDPLQWTTSSRIVPEGSDGFNDPQGIDVEVRAFSDIVAGIGSRVALVKMDIEGSEFAILRRIFADPGSFNIDAIFCETHERHGHASVAEVVMMRAAAARLDRPAINLYWP